MAALATIPGVGPQTEIKLNRLKIYTLLDLLYHFPRSYLDFSHFVHIKDLEIDTNATIKGTVVSFQTIYTRSHKNLQKAKIKDSSGIIELIWFNQPYLSTTIKTGEEMSFAGSVTEYLGKKTMISPILGKHNTGKIIAVYPETKNLTSGWFRKTISQHLELLLSQVTDPFPPQILKRFSLFPLIKSLRTIHSPSNQSDLEQSQLRLSLDEIVSILAQSWLQKKHHDSLSPVFTLAPSPKINLFIKKLPFKLTKSQVKVWSEIYSDLTSNRPTNRLLQGDVGSGKTVIAALGCLLVHLNHHLSLLIAPTEILAQQHFSTFKKFFPKVPLHLLTNKSKIKFDNLPPDSIIIATHAALFQAKNLKNKVALLIIDEQHKFGVDQRTFLSDRLHPPHTITMTATPIPRTIGLTLLGNLDISTINTLPSNRIPVKTFLVPKSKTPDCYSWLESHIKKTRQQAFIVCPFIEESETLSSVKSVKTEFDYLSKHVFVNLKLALIHGKTPPATRQKILSDFQKNKINILVTTPIIEVGIDFPNSTTIIIQSADRFGLAQLHQLRGRVGRGADQSFCYLFTESTNSKAVNRLQYLSKHHHGQRIAEYDLKIRGPGEFFSTIQHGFPSLKLASLSDTKLISLGQAIVSQIIRDNPQFNLRSLTKTPKTDNLSN